MPKFPGQFSNKLKSQDKVKILEPSLATFHFNDSNIHCIHATIELVQYVETVGFHSTLYWIGSLSRASFHCNDAI
jgi:hypothetical protein